MKTHHIYRSLLFALLFTSVLACQKDEFKRHNDAIIGNYEVVRQEIYHYHEAYTGIDTIIIDTTYSETLIWELTKKDSTDIQFNGKRFGLVKDDPISDWTFNYKPGQDNYYAGTHYFAQVRFFPEQDSFYMEEFFSDASPIAGVEIASTTYVGKQQ